jgi:hypothetical protein
MKKIILVLTAVIAFSASQAQTKFGLKGGVNLSKERYPELSLSSDSKVGFLVGGFVTIPAGKTMSIQTELLFQTLGGKAGVDKVNTSYLQVPVLFKFSAGKKVYFEAGPQIGFLLSAKSGKTNEKDAYKSTDLQLALGTGFNLNKQVSLGLRYGSTLGSMIKDAKAKNQSFALSLAYSF